MVLSREHHQSARVKVKITRQDCLSRNRRVGLLVKLPYAVAAEASLAVRQTPEQGIRDVHAGAPTGPFVTRGGTELALVRPAAQRAFVGIQRRVVSRWVLHGRLRGNRLRKRVRGGGDRDDSNRNKKATLVHRVLFQVIQGIGGRQKAGAGGDVIRAVFIFGKTAAQ
jgi:hypothetical protein